MRTLLLLVADRNEARLAYYRSSLADDFCTVVPVTTTAQCLTMLREFTPDVMVLEAEFPGAERVLDVLAHQPTGAHVGVLVHSSSGHCPTPAALAQFLRSEMSGRPLPSEELGPRVRRLVAGSGVSETAHPGQADGEPGPVPERALPAGRRILQKASWN